MGGSISADTVWKIIEKTGSHHVADSYARVVEKLVCLPGTPKDFQTFLDKFKILDEVVWDAESIELACKQICEDTKRSGTESVDISFSIEKYARSGLWYYDEVICFICDTYAKYAEQYQIEVKPILSISYHSPRANQQKVADLINNQGVRDKIAGLDLVGDERYYDSDFYGPIIERWNRAGKITREHIAELPEGSDNLMRIFDRPEIQRPKRIAHGIQGRPEDLKKAVDAGMIFDVALYSNLATGAICDIRNHPLPRMIRAGCIVTLNTDDPVQFGKSLDDEFELALANNLIDYETAVKIQENACINIDYASL